MAPSLLPLSVTGPFFDGEDIGWPFANSWDRTTYAPVVVLRNPNVCQKATNDAKKAQGRVRVHEAVTQRAGIVVNKKLPDGTRATGEGGVITDTITSNGRQVSGAPVSETNVYTVAENGKTEPLPIRQGSAATNNAGQLGDIVGLYASPGTASRDAALVHTLTANSVTLTDVNTIKFTVPGGATYAATATRTLTNGTGGSNYTLTTTQPVIVIVPR